MAGNKVFVSQSQDELLGLFRTHGEEGRRRLQDLLKRQTTAEDAAWFEIWSRKNADLAPKLDPQSRSILHALESHLQKLIQPIGKRTA